MLVSTSSTFSSFFGSGALAWTGAETGAEWTGAEAKESNCLTLTPDSKLIAAKFLNPFLMMCGTEVSLTSPITKDKAAKFETPF
jgi:hypothetical protein